LLEYGVEPDRSHRVEFRKELAVKID
jgi:hypothetical protein